MAEPIINTLGIVGMKNCGAYDSSTNYEKLNVVTYQGSSYCAKGNTVGNLPTNTTYWDLIAQKGDKGDTGDTGPQGPKPVKGVDYYTAEDKAELENQLSSDVTAEVTEQIGEISTGTPLIASSTSDMTDTSRIYVNTTDGHWYWYNGTAWTDGGVYQAAEDSLTVDLLDEKLDKYKYDKLNLIDQTKWTDGKYVNSNNGNLGTSAAYSVTDYMFLEANVRYEFFGFNNTFFAFYDLNKNYIVNDGYVHATANTDHHKYIVTDRDCYFRASTNLSWKTYCFISKYVDVPRGFNEYGMRYTDNYSLINERGKASGEYNLFNKLCGYITFDYADGKPTYTTDVIGSDYIPIEGDLYYCLVNGKLGDIQYIFEYDENKDFIKYTSTSGKTLYHLTLDSDTKFIRFRSNTASTTYILPDIDFYNENLMICDKEEYLVKFVKSEKIINTNDVSYDFFKSPSTFKRTFIKTALDNYISAIKNNGYDLVVPIMTDLHSATFEGYSMLNYLAGDGFADACFNLGDNIPEHYDTLEEAVALMKNYMFVSNGNPKKSEVYVLRGNHDTNPHQGTPPSDENISVMINDSLYYSLADFRTKKGMADSGCNYGYIDTNAKVRLIFLDTSDIFSYGDDGKPIFTGYNTGISQKQLDWFCHSALNFENKTDRSEWGIIILAHDRLAGICAGFATILEAFMNGTSTSGTTNIAGRTTNPIVLSYNVDFTNQGPMELICAVNGHLHDDKVEDIGTTGRKQISIACDSAVAYYYDNGVRTQYTRTKGTIEEHLMDTLCLNKKTKTIYMKRLGVGTDRTYSYE